MTSEDIKHQLIIMIICFLEKYWILEQYLNDNENVFKSSLKKKKKNAAV